MVANELILILFHPWQTSIYRSQIWIFWKIPHWLPDEIVRESFCQANLYFVRSRVIWAWLPGRSKEFVFRFTTQPDQNKSLRCVFSASFLDKFTVHSRVRRSSNRIGHRTWSIRLVWLLSFGASRKLAIALRLRVTDICTYQWFYLNRFM